MSLTPGTRIGVCQIAAQIGVGGMGEVYQVTDTTLTRQVAIPDFTLRDGSIRDLGVRGHGFVHVAPGWLAFQQGTTVLAVAFDPANPA